MCLKKSYFPNCLKILSTVSIFNNVGERSNAKYYCLNSCLSVGSKIFEKLVNIRLLNPLENCGLFLISSMILVLLNQWKIQGQLYVTEFLGLLIDRGLLKLQHFIIQGFWKGLACWSFSQTQVLRNVRLSIWFCFIFSQ